MKCRKDTTQDYWSISPEWMSSPWTAEKPEPTMNYNHQAKNRAWAMQMEQVAAGQKPWVRTADPSST